MYQQQFATYNPQQAQQQAQQQQFYAQCTGSTNFGAQQFATVGGPGAVAGVHQPMQAAVAQWVPQNPVELQYYGVLFAMADEEKRGAIGGRLAVAFFSRSKLDKLVLREVWNIADSMQRSELSRNEFYVAMRLISMAQRGEPVALQRFLETAQMPHPLPVLEGVPPPPPMPVPGAMAPPMAAPQPPMPGQPGVAATPHSAGGYAVNEEEKSRYDAIFRQYDADGDGFLLGSEAVALFQMSGLDRNALRDIWAMADKGQDSKLDLQEFYVAMHLIVCVSKRNLPLPSSLPQELHDSVFGLASPAVASSGQVAQQPPAPASSDDPMDAFAELAAPVNDAPLPTLSPPEPLRQTSFHQEPSRQSSFHQEPPAQPMHATEAAFHQAPTPSDNGPARRNSGASVDGVRHESASGWPAVQVPQQPPATPTSLNANRERTNSASSMSSMSSFTGMAPPVRAMGSNDRLNSMGGHPPIPHPPAAGGMMGGFPMQQQMQPTTPSSMPANAYPAPAPAAVAPKPFMSDEEEQSAVRELEQQNEQVADALTKVESKQKAIESLAEKLRDLDQLRHELVTLVMKREKLRAATATSAASAPAEDPAEVQTRLAVERSLRELVDQEKQHVQKLQADISRLGSKLQTATLSSSTSASDAFGGFAKPTIGLTVSSSPFSPLANGSAGANAASGGASGDFDAGFGDFAGATSSSGGADAFSDINFD